MTDVVDDGELAVEMIRNSLLCAFVPGGECFLREEKSAVDSGEGGGGGSDESIFATALFLSSFSNQYSTNPPSAKEQFSFPCHHPLFAHYPHFSTSFNDLPLMNQMALFISNPMGGTLKF